MNYPKVRPRDCFLGEHGAAMSEAALLSLSYMFSGLLLGCPSYEGGATPSVPGVLHTYRPSETYGKVTTKTLLQTMQTGCVATTVYFEANAFGPKCYGHPMGSLYILQK